jgi:hypothetical protein
VRSSRRPAPATRRTSAAASGVASDGLGYSSERLVPFAVPIAESDANGSSYPLQVDDPVAVLPATSTTWYDCKTVPKFLSP